MDKDAVIHFLSGGLSGATAATVINPLEVVKTRLQSSNRAFAAPMPSLKCDNNPVSSNSSQSTIFKHLNLKTSSGIPLDSLKQHVLAPAVIPGSSTAFCPNNIGRKPTVFSKQANIFRQITHIIEREGVLSLWKGYGTTLIGVFPARAIYFFTYNDAQRMFNKIMPEESSQVHASSAAVASICCSTITNPLWVVRTRLQLDQKNSHFKMSISTCIRRIYNELGAKGFYKGVTASYLGLVETVINFTIYERLKRSSFLGGGGDQWKKKGGTPEGGRGHASSTPYMTFGLYLRLMVCGSISRMIGATIGYPHEVVRTRLREENSRYNGLFRTFQLIVREEGWRALYGGLSVHLMRTVPNTAITLATYESLVVLFTNLS